MKPSGLIALQVLVVVLFSYYPSSVTSDEGDEDLAGVEALQQEIAALQTALNGE